MVNVAGRSKGCATCRRRKVKCDLGFPQCQRCIDMGLACPGPRVGAFFVHSQPAASTAPPEPSSPSALTRIPPSSSAVKACRAQALDQLFVSHFIESFGLPRNTGGAGPTWLERLPSFLGTQDKNSSSSSSAAAAATSIRSASMLSYGTWAHDASIQADSYRWYASALAQLSRSLAQGRLLPAATVEMAACAAVMLIHFETWAGTSRNAWVHHVKGAASLLEAAGPRACRTGFLQSVFSHLRFQVFIATMQENTLHAFAEPGWLDIPFRERGKTLFDELVDVLFAAQTCLFLAHKTAQVVRGEETTATLKELVDSTWLQVRRWEGRYAVFLRPSLDGHAITLAGSPPLDKTGVAQAGEAAALLCSPPEAALLSLFHAARLIVSQLASATGADAPDTAREDGRFILDANAFVNQHNSGPGSKIRPFTTLPSLKIISIWSPMAEAREEARVLLMDETFLNSPMAEIASTSDGYFSSVAAKMRSTA